MNIATQSFINQSFSGQINESGDYECDLEHSFFKNISQAVTAVSNENVTNFEFNDKEASQDCYKFENSKILSTKSSKKTADCSFKRDRSTPGSEIFFSGYFGQKQDNPSFNDYENMNKYAMSTNPFPCTEEEKVKKGNFNLAFGVLNSKRQKLNEKSFVGRNLNHFNGPNPVTCRVETSVSSRGSLQNYQGNTTSTSFNDLVKSVSLTSLSNGLSRDNKKKSIFSINFRIAHKRRITTA